MQDLGDIKGARVLVRLGVNVPVARDVVQEPFRLEVLLPTIQSLKNAGARILLVGHMGSDGTHSLRPVHTYLQQALGHIRFVDHVPFDANILAEGEIAMLENIRRYEGEKENSEELAKQLASCADIYINEAFADSHREHASIVGVAQLLPSYIGPWFEKEITELSKAFDPEHPFEFIVGGAKIETKLPLVRKFLDIADHVFVGGALANDIWDSKGYTIGRSLVSATTDIADVLLHDRLALPSDVLVERAGETVTLSPDALLSHDRIVDAGMASVDALASRIVSARTIVWNGPLGATAEGYGDATEAIARHIADAPGYAIVGGGDTVAAISKLDVFDRYGFVSTGGGAMLQFLSDETLVGLEAIRGSWRR